jgi:hypothetical protein
VGVFVAAPGVIGVRVAVGVRVALGVRVTVGVRVGVAVPTAVTYCEATQPLPDGVETGMKTYPPDATA